MIFSVTIRRSMLLSIFSLLHDFCGALCRPVGQCQMLFYDTTTPPFMTRPRLHDANSWFIQEQNDRLWSLKDHLEKSYSKAQWDELIEHNKLHRPKGPKAIVDVLADAISFGVPQACKDCDGGLLTISSHGYKCTGQLTEWTRCMFEIQTPLRTKLKLSYSFDDDAVLKKNIGSGDRKFPPKVDIPQSVGDSVASSSRCVSRWRTISLYIQIQWPACALRNVQLDSINTTKFEFGLYSCAKRKIL